VLRYGTFYGPGTWYAGDGDIAEQVRRRRFPMVGAGEGVQSFVHVQDAATATVHALAHGAAGVYNVVDDEPLAQREWLTLYARASGPHRPVASPYGWLARRWAPPRCSTSPGCAGPATLALAAGLTGRRAMSPCGPALSPTWLD